MSDSPINGRLLLVLFDWIYLLAVTAWTGGVLFCSFLVFPLISRALGPEARGRIESTVFPRYYGWGASAGAVALATCVCGALSVPELRGPRIAVQAALILTGILLAFYGGNSLAPALAASQANNAERVQRLRIRGARLNAIVLVIGMALLATFATRPNPATQGIIEPTPQVRARQEEEQYRKNRQTRASQQTAPDSASPAPLLRGSVPR